MRSWHHLRLTQPSQAPDLKSLRWNGAVRVCATMGLNLVSEAQSILHMSYTNAFEEREGGPAISFSPLRLYSLDV